MSKTDYKDQIVWIIGASSGIGLALARELSARGATLILSARRKNELENLRTDLGSHHQVFDFDVTDPEATLHITQEIYAMFGRIDRIVFLAAAYTPMKLDALNVSLTKTIVDVNLMGAFNLIYAAVPILSQQKSKGQIALCGSIAGYTGLPGGQPYSATKAAIINLAESLFVECGHNLDVKLISPGFVHTPLTDKNKFQMPMIIKPDEAAKEIADGLLAKPFEIHFPKKMTFLLKAIRVLPYFLSLPLAKIIQNKR